MPRGVRAIGSGRFTAPTALVTQGWQQSPMWIFVLRILTGPFPIMMSAVVHNGQITNYWLMRRQMEREGQRFMSNCDSELLAVYVRTTLQRADA